MFRALNETFVDEVNGGQAAVSGSKFVTINSNHSATFALC